MRSAARLWLAYPVLYSSAVSRLRRPFLSDRYFFVTVRLLKGRAQLVDADFRLLALGAGFYLSYGKKLGPRWNRKILWAATALSAVIWSPPYLVAALRR